MNNIINPNQLEQAIAARSSHRPIAVQNWLGNQFRRWALRTFDQLETVNTTQDYERLVGTPAPGWFTSKQQAGQLFQYLDPNHPQLRELETKTAEYLSTKASGDEARKFPRYTVPQVLDKWAVEHQRALNKQAQGWCQTDGSAIRNIISADGYQVVEFIGSGRRLRAELSNESYAMQHCVGQFQNRETLSGGYGESYVQGVEDGTLRIFSIRDEHHHAHVTLAFTRSQVEQIKGKQNRPPVERYVPAVIAVLNHLNINDLNHYDCHIMGVFFEQGQAKRFAHLKDQETQLHAISLNPELILQLSKPSAALRWAALRKHPQMIETLPDCSPAQLYCAAQWLEGDLPATLASPEPEWLRGAVSGERSLQMAGQTLSTKPLPTKAPSRWRRAMNWWDQFLDKLPTIILIPLYLLLLAAAVLAIVPIILGVVIKVTFQSLTGQLDTEQQARANWAMGLAGIFIFRFEDHYEAFTIDPEEEEFAERQNSLAEDWGIGGADVPQATSRQQCLQQIKSMWQNGHFGSYIYNCDSRYTSKDILAFDLHRMGLLIRTGVLLGYISEEEGWNYSFCGAAQVQDIFQSWDDYGESYIRGRAWWAGQDPQRIRDEYQQFRADRKCSWNKLPWRDFEVFAAQAADDADR